MIDDLKTVCANFGLGNASSEYKIITEIFLYKFLNDYLEEMAKTIYDYWFVQYDFPNENNKPYKASGSKMVNADGHIIPEG